MSVGVSGLTPQSDDEQRAASHAAMKRLLWLALAASIVLIAGIIAVHKWGGAGARRDTLVGVSLMAPSKDSSVARGPVRFTWRRIPSALRYILELQAGDGTVLLSLSTVDTSLSTSLATIPVGNHRWLVHASTDFGMDITSEARLLRVH